MDNPQIRFNQAMRDLCDGDRRITSVCVSELAKLIAEGANPSELAIPVELDGSGGKTSGLIVAAARGWDRLVSLFLLDEGLDVNVMDVDGEHALFAALKNGEKASAKLLLARSNVWRLEDSDASCLHIAIRRGLAEEAEAIVELMGEAECQKEFDVMREQISDGDGAVGHAELEARMLGMLLSKAERLALASATENGPQEQLGGAHKRRSL